MSTVKLERLSNFPGEEGTDALFRGSAQAAGFDVLAAATVMIRPGDRAMIPTGIKLSLPDDMEAQVRPRSGLAIKKGLTIINSPGTVDADFRGEVMVLVHNTNPVISAELWLELLRLVDVSDDNDQPLIAKFRDYIEEATITVKRGERVAQIVFNTFAAPTIVEVTHLDETDRGEGGMGSTGGASGL